MYLKDFVGQKKLKEQLLAVLTETKVPNILLRGAYGFGKTTLAILLAQVLGFFSVQVPYDGIINISPLTNICVVDECHMLNNFEELYPIMNSYSLIFCTNMDSKLPEPFINRCFDFRLGSYNVSELGKIISLHSELNGLKFDWPVCLALANRCKGNPRTGVMLMRKISALCRYRDYLPTLSAVGGILEELEIDQWGLTPLDRQYLNLLKTGAKSKSTLGAALQLDQLALSRIEGYLIKTERVCITSRGRVLV